MARTPAISLLTVRTMCPARGLGRVPSGSDGGIDEHEPVDPLRMTCRQPRRDGSAKGVPGDVRSGQTFGGYPIRKPIRGVIQPRPADAPARPKSREIDCVGAEASAKAGTFRPHQRPEPESPWSRISGGPEPTTS